MSDDEKYHYDAEDRYVGRTSNRPPGDDGVVLLVGIIVAVVLLCVAAINTWEMLGRYNDFSEPYRTVTLFYYYSVKVPIEAVANFVSYLHRPGVTDYKNLNILIMVATPVLAAGLIFQAFLYLYEKNEGMTKKLALYSLAIFQLLPISMAGLWSLWRWLLEK